MKTKKNVLSISNGEASMDKLEFQYIFVHLTTWIVIFLYIWHTTESVVTTFAKPYIENELYSKRKQSGYIIIFQLPWGSQWWKQLCEPTQIWEGDGNAKLIIKKEEKETGRVSFECV